MSTMREIITEAIIGDLEWLNWNEDQLLMALDFDLGIIDADIDTVSENFDELRIQMTGWLAECDDRQVFEVHEYFREEVGGAGRADEAEAA